jgi:dihydrolipoamide dehydrogenase
MQTLHCDVAIIGAGTAGLSAYRAARAAGKHAILIEGGLYGTTCARVGCMPSKLLIAAAEAAHAVTAAPGFGVHPGPLRIDGVQVMARVRSERDRFVGFVLDAVAKLPEADKLRGYARFLAPDLLQIDHHTQLQASSVVIATGSSASLPAAWTAASGRVIHSDAVFEWSTLPAAVAVVGSGVIGLELGQALQRLGVRVTVYARGSSVAQLGDPAVLASARSALGGELDLRSQTEVLALSDVGDQVQLRSRDGSGAVHSDSFDYVLAAIGRTPNLGRLELEKAGVARDAHGIPLYDRDTMQCGSSAIFIAGDASDELALLPQAAEQGALAGANAARFPQVQAGLRRTPLIIAFTEPQIATVGASFQQLCSSHLGHFAIGQVDFGDQGRSRVMRQNLGLLRVYGEYGSGRFLGAEMIGPRAEHIGHLLAWAHQAAMTVAQMVDMPFYHPVVEEGLRTALRELAQRLLQEPSPPQPCPDCTPGT